MPCLKSKAISGPCNTPGLQPHSTGDQTHIVGMTLFCADHCPECHPPAAREFLDSQPAAAPVNGTQWSLFK